MTRAVSTTARRSSPAERACLLDWSGEPPLAVTSPSKRAEIGSGTHAPLPPRGVSGDIVLFRLKPGRGGAGRLETGSWCVASCGLFVSMSHRRASHNGHPPIVSTAPNGSPRGSGLAQPKDRNARPPSALAGAGPLAQSQAGFEGGDGGRLVAPTRLSLTSSAIGSVGRTSFPRPPAEATCASGHGESEPRDVGRLYFSPATPRPLSSATAVTKPRSRGAFGCLLPHFSSWGSGGGETPGIRR